MSTPHRWTMGVFADGSGVWLCEWRGEYEHRCWTPNTAQPRPWEPDECHPEFRGITNNAGSEIPRRLARELLATWRYCRKRKIEEGWRQL